jgi:Mg2+ and Co2+ transporter CorA
MIELPALCIQSVLPLYFLFSCFSAIMETNYFNLFFPILSQHVIQNAFAIQGEIQAFSSLFSTESSRAYKFSYSTTERRFIRKNAEDATFDTTRDLYISLRNVLEPEIDIDHSTESATTFEVIDLPLAKEIQDEISPLRETFLDCNLIFPFEENKTLTTGRLLCSQSKDTILLATPEHSRPYLYLLLKSFETTGNQRRWQGVFVHEDEREWQGRLKTLAYHRLESSSETSTTATDSFNVFALFVRDIVMQYITSVTSEAEALMIMIRRVQDLLRPNRSERLSDLLREINAISYQLRISSLETQFAFSADAAKWTKDAFRPFKNEKSDYEVFISVRRMQQYHPDLLREMIAEVRQQIVDVAAEEKQAKEELRQKQEEERQKQEDAHQKRRQMQDDERATNEGRLLAESIRIAEETQRDSRTMRGIAWVTIAFLPATFVSSFFGMNFFNGIAGNVPFDEASRNVWLFFVVAVPVSAIVLSTFYFWDRHEQMNDDRKLKESKDDYELRLIGRR